VFSSRRTRFWIVSGFVLADHPESTSFVDTSAFLVTNLGLGVELWIGPYQDWVDDTPITVTYQNGQYAEDRRAAGPLACFHAQCFFADTLPSSYLADSGDPRPIQTKPRAMPVHDGSRSDQDERLGPPGPERSQRNPGQLVQGS
jgi:hypothetical protein